MRVYTLKHLSDEAVLRDLAAAACREHTSTAWVLAHTGEADERRLYRPAGFPSMHAYCVEKLRFSEDAAYKRIQAARAARRFPVIFEAVAEGRLHLTGVVLLSPHLTEENADELITAVTHKSKFQIRQLLAERFPRSEMLALVQPILTPPGRSELVPEPVGVGTMTDGPAPAPAHTPLPRSGVKPHAFQRFAFQITVGQDTYDKFQYIQELLSHVVPSGDVAEVLDRTFDAAIPQFEKRKFAATTKPRRQHRRSSSNRRHIPAHIKRAVWKRDQGQCTFVGESGHRCPARRFLEFDHVDPVARGGQATVAGVRLRCRPHNQYAAECTFGAGFMEGKREEARRAAEARARAAAAEAHARAAAGDQAKDVMACLRELGFRADEARRAIQCCETLPDATLEERVRATLRFLCPKTRFQGRVETALGVPI